MLLSFEAKQAQQRFQTRLTKEDDHYVYVEMFPGNPDDKRDFTRAQVVIDKATYLPRRLWYAVSDGTSNLYDITRIITKP